MRLLITLQSLKHCAYDEKYHHKVRGFLYSFQRDSERFNRHNIDGYKFFTFSNIFLVKNMNYGDRRSFIVSCPSKDWVYWLRGIFSEIQELKKAVNIGEMQFLVEGVKTLHPKIWRKASLITGTPIILRIPKEKYQEYGISSVRPYEYWRPRYDFNAFLKQLSDNLVKKYNQYYGKELKNMHLFEEFKFRKEVCVHRIEKGIEIKTIGTIWEFGFNHLDEKKREILALGLESGFGELNSSGFGFMNKMEG